MRHAGGMRRVERVGNLGKKINCALEAQGISLETRHEASAPTPAPSLCRAPEDPPAPLLR